VKTDNNASWTSSPEVRSTYSEDGAVLLHIGKGICYSLNSVAARIWVAIEASPEGTTLDGVVTALETHFSRPRQELEEDSKECLQTLERMGLIQCNGKPTPEKSGKWWSLRL
jgi:hypothetical protein